MAGFPVQDGGGGARSRVAVGLSRAVLPWWDGSGTLEGLKLVLIVSQFSGQNGHSSTEMP
jgi:hypothetical protein